MDNLHTINILYVGMLKKSWEISKTDHFCTFNIEYYGIYFKDFGHLYIRLRRL